MQPPRGGSGFHRRAPFPPLTGFSTAVARGVANFRLIHRQDHDGEIVGGREPGDGLTVAMATGLRREDAKKFSIFT